MAIVRAVKSGNWSDTTVWNTGALPTSADDVYSNTFTVTINVSPTVLQISNMSATGVTQGGSFVISSNGITLTANVNAAGISNACLTVSVTTGQTASVVGNCTGGNANGGSHAVVNSSSGTLNITGNCIGNAGGIGAFNSSSGILNITGNCVGGAGFSGASGAYNNSSGTLNVTGSTTGASSATAAPGINNANVGILNHVGTVTSGTGASGITSVGSINAVNILSGPFITSNNGVNPVYAVRWFWQNTTPPATYYQIRSANLSVIRPLYTADSVGGNPAASNVRSGTVYGPNNELTGTCAVPPAGSVALGVPVDDTTGTAAITAANIRAAVGLASANLDSQLAAIPTTAAPNASSIASQVRTELAPELGNLDATVSSRLAPGGTLARVTLTDTATTLTNAPSVPSPETVAAAVRTNLTPELARMANAATTQEVGDIVEGALD